MYYKKGSVVEKGTYWGVETGNRYNILSLQELTENSIKAPVIVMLALAPMIGLLFAVFLPLIGILMTMKLIYDKVYDKIAIMAIFSWSPIRAYFLGRSKKK